MIIDHGKRLLMLKFVWWGPAMSGKSTTVKYLFKKYNRLEELKSIETTTGRTLFFDYGDLIFTKGSWTIKISIWTCTGQNFYSETRPTVLNGADGLIFIADAQKSLLNDNIESWNELKGLLNDKISKIPLIICLNKIDLEDNDGVITVEELKKHLKVDNRIPIIPTIATQGYNVFESFSELLNKVKLG
ncbi:MAG: GTPase domain-containing protein [Candidatus Helarchaeota archaeon]